MLIVHEVLEESNRSDRLSRASLPLPLFLYLFLSLSLLFLSLPPSLSLSHRHSLVSRAIRRLLEEWQCNVRLNYLRDIMANIVLLSHENDLAASHLALCVSLRNVDNTS